MTCINCRENRDRFQNSSNLNSNRVNKKSKPSTENSDDVIAFAPDGGYAWVILACSFYSSFCMEGLIASFGLLLPSLMREFKASAAVVSILNSTLIGIFLVLGYFSSLLIKRCWSWYAICTFNNDRKPVLRSQALSCQWNIDFGLRHRSTGDVTNHREISGGLWMARISADLFLFYLTIVCLCLSNETCQNVQQSGAEK